MLSGDFRSDKTPPATTDIMTKRTIHLLALVCVLLFPGTPVFGSARILNFHSNIEIGRDGNLTVTEYIRVNDQGHEIRHGIYRFIPTRRRTYLEIQFQVGFRVLGATVDGRPVPVRIRHTEEGIRIFITRDRLLSRGVHTFTLRYRTTS